MDVHLGGGGALAQLEVTFAQQVPGLAGEAARHRAAQVQAAAAGKQALQLLVLSLLYRVRLGLG